MKFGYIKLSVLLAIGMFLIGCGNNAEQQQPPQATTTEQQEITPGEETLAEDEYWAKDNFDLQRVGDDTEKHGLIIGGRRRAHRGYEARRARPGFIAQQQVANGRLVAEVVVSHPGEGQFGQQRAVAERHAHAQGAGQCQNVEIGASPERRAVQFDGEAARAQWLG